MTTRQTLLTLGALIIGAFILRPSAPTTAATPAPPAPAPITIHLTLTMPDQPANTVTQSATPEINIQTSGNEPTPITIDQPITVHVAIGDTTVAASPTVQVVTPPPTRQPDITHNVTVNQPPAPTTTTTMPPAPDVEAEEQPEPPSPTTTTTTLPIETIDGVYWVRGCEIKRDSACTDWDLSIADLSGRRIDRVNFQGSDLTGANLSGAIIDTANLTHTNLTGANLQGATIRETSVAGATMCGTIWTNGTIRNEGC